MKVFFTALDWGLGHTARIIPIIVQYKKEGHSILIGCSKRQKQLFQQHLSNVEYIDFKSVYPHLSKTGNQTIPWISFAFKFFFFTLIERWRVKKIHTNYGFDIIVTDNRYGIYNKACKNIIITHQLNLVLPKPFHFFTGLTNHWIHKQINRFDQCLVPDIIESENLAGKLSMPCSGIKTKIRFIGPLSRLNLVNAEVTMQKDIVVLVSGPENQRTVYEDLLLTQLKEFGNKYSYILLGGRPEKSEEDNTEVINNIAPGKLKYLLQQAKYIFCRSGYSSLMDLVSLNKTAYLVPTPGQSEQEHLAEYLSEQGWFLMCKQENFNLLTALDQLDHFEARDFPPEWAQRSIESFSI